MISIQTNWTKEIDPWINLGVQEMAYFYSQFPDEAKKMGYSIDSLEEEIDSWINLGVQEMTYFYSQFPDEAKKMGYSIDSLEDDVAYDYEVLVDRFYPLENQIQGNDKVIELCRNGSNVTVMRNVDTQEDYIALTACGSDFSQNIAEAYLILTGYIPLEVAMWVNKQPYLSLSRERWIKTFEAVKKSLNQGNNEIVRQYKEVVEKLLEASESRGEKKRKEKEEILDE